MRKVLIALISLFVLFPAAVALSEGHKVITSQELQGMMKQDGSLKIVDVRENSLFKAGHIPGAVNVPYDGAKDRILEMFKPDEKIVFVCHGGPMGDELSGILTKNGYKEVYNLKGGMNKWNGPLTTK